MLYRKSATSWRILAASFAAGRGGATFETTSFPSLAPSGYSFAFINGLSLLFGVVNPATGTLQNASGSLGGASWSLLTPLDGYYHIKPLGSDWWLWKDQETTTSYGTTTDLSMAGGQPH